MFKSFFNRGQDAQSNSKVKSISAAQLNELLEVGEEIVLVDVRSPREYQYEGHVRGARLLPLQALSGRIDVRTFRHVWAYNKADGVSMIITFMAVLLFGIEMGILIGVAAAILLFVRRTSHPHIAIVGRLGENQIYLNVLRHDVQTYPTVIAIRVDESLYFANIKYLEDTILQQVTDNPSVDHLVLIATAVNFIDASALETLRTLQKELADAGVDLHLAGIKGPVMDRLKQIGFIDRFGQEYVHARTHQAMAAIGCLPEQA